MKSFDELRESKTVDLQEASTKVKTTMPDKVASSATRFGLKAKSQGGSVSISGPKGKLHDFLRAIIGRSSYGNASEQSESALEENKIFFVKVGDGRDSMTVKTKASNSREALKSVRAKHPKDKVSLDSNQKQGQPAGALESVEEAYRKPTQAEIDADRRKEGKGKDTSSRYKNIKKKMYGNAMGGLKKEESESTDEYGQSIRRVQAKKTRDSLTPNEKNKLAKLHALMKKQRKTGNYKMESVDLEGQKVDEAKLSDMGIHNKIADRNLLIKAIKTAEKMGGNMTGAVREIEKMQKGLSKHKAVRAALQQANESVRSADKKPQNFRDPETGKTKVRMVPVDRDIASRKTNESVELDEAADFEKMSKELLKKKKLGIEFEKAAAFARVMFMNSSLSVQDKAMKGLLTLIKGIDDLTVKTTLIKILKDNGFKVKGGRVMREEVELDEALQSVTKIKFDYKDTMPKDPKPSDVGGLKQDWNNDRTAVRSAVKPLGGLVTDSEAPSRTNKFVGTLSVGTRGDVNKLSNSAIQKAVKSKGTEIQNNQFMSESVESLDENYRTLATHGMGAETKNTINVGRVVDYYEPKNGDKRTGKITKMTRSGYVVKDEDSGKSHTFAFHDRAKAKEIMAKSK